MQERAYPSVQKSSGLRSSIHELYQDDGAQLLLEKPARLILLGVYGLLVSLLVATVWIGLVSTDITIRVRGELRPESPAQTVASPFAGELADLYVTVGMPVKQGDIIARVRSSELLTRAIENLHAQIDLMAAEKAYALVRQTGSIPDERTVSRDDGDLSIREARLRLDLARLKVMTGAVAPDHIDSEGALRLFSPSDGFIQEVFQGQAPVAANQPLAKITSTRNLAFYIEVPERERRHLREGLPVHIQLDALSAHTMLHGVLAYLSSIPELSTHGGNTIYSGRVDLHHGEDGVDRQSIRLHQGLHGRADIVLNKRRLIDLVF
jgi:multidrug efflux pump subunit AcrA (membrane-fusion protein)